MSPNARSKRPAEGQSKSELEAKAAKALGKEEDSSVSSSDPVKESEREG